MAAFEPVGVIACEVGTRRHIAIPPSNTRDTHSPRTQTSSQIWQNVCESEELYIFVSFVCEIIYLITGFYNLIEVALFRNSQILENLMMGSGEFVQLTSIDSV